MTLLQPSIHVCASSWLASALALALLGCSSSVNSPAASPSRVQILKGDPETQPLAAMPVPQATESPAPEENPFEGAAFYVNPDYQQNIEKAIARQGAKVPALARLRGQSTAVWLDTIAATANIPTHLKNAAEQARRGGKPVVPVFVVYDLPNRDCSAKSSAGELTIEAKGEERYRSEFIDAIAKTFATYPEQRIVVILEPDSLPNVVTNTGVEKCALSANVYKNSIAYAIAKLSLPNVHIYLDGAHAGWLGWEGNRENMADVVKEVLVMAGGTNRIRGLATNVSNYNALAGDYGTKLEPSTPTPNELVYIQKMSETLAKKGITNKKFLIDTSRNGRGDMRTKWGNWCNIRGAGLGERPRVSPLPLLDAYVWVKPPGESDGTADPAAARFDENCASADATPGAPEAGQWFESYLLGLIERAEPAL
jgi:cellulose 1,4-beta-cellobiosidase